MFLKSNAKLLVSFPGFQGEDQLVLWDGSLGGPQLSSLKQMVNTKLIMSITRIVPSKYRTPDS